MDFKRALNYNSLEEQRWNSLSAVQTSEDIHYTDLFLYGIYVYVYNSFSAFQSSEDIIILAKSLTSTWVKSSFRMCKKELCSLNEMN